MKHKKILSAVLAACILAGSSIASLPASAENGDTGILPYESYREYGDVNLDLSVDVADAVVIARFYAMDYTLQITDLGKQLGDVNLDGNLDDEDLKQVLEYIAHKRTQLGVADKPVEHLYQAVNLTEQTESGEATGKEADEAFISSQMKLTVGLFKGSAADRQSEGQNVLISPLSISQALAMTANGANGETRTEMEKLLGDTIRMDELNRYYYDYTADLTGSEDAALHLANSIWINNKSETLQVRTPFLQTAKDYYRSEVFAAPFDDSTLNDVNNWVNTNTHEMIPKLLDTLDPQTQMILINALAFEAEWYNPYRADREYDRTFHADTGDITATLMYSDERTYLEDEKATGFIKPYEGGRYSFAALLPNEDVSLSEYIKGMTPESLTAFLNSKRSEEVVAAIPKFEDDYSISLDDVLKKLSMESAFTDSADFSELNAKKDSKIDTVIHKTFVKVDERGTKAGAVTAVMIAPTSAIPEDTPQPKYVILDRPFIYMILDNKTNLPVFIGYVLHPTAVEAAEAE